MSRPVPDREPGIQLLCTDLDRTLLPNGQEPESPGARELLADLVQRSGIALAFVTGRDEGRVREAIERWSLPTPAWVIADVGSTLLQVEPSDSWPVDTGWQQHIRANWNPARVRELSAECPALRLQEADRQGLCKVSFYVDVDLEMEALIERVRAHLSHDGLAAQVLYSHDPEKGTGLIDVLPERASKAQAICWLMQKLALAPDQVLFAGDSGNDIDALLGPWHSVLVANGDGQARAAVRQAIGNSASGARVYEARGGCQRPDGQVMNGCYAAGIVEALLRLMKNPASPL